MAVAKRRKQREGKRMPLNVPNAIATVLKATPSERETYARALGLLHYSLAREAKASVTIPSPSFPQSHDRPSRLASPGSTNHRVNAQRDEIEPPSHFPEAVVDFYLKLAEREQHIRTFFRRGDHLSCVDQVYVGEDARIHDFTEGQGREVTSATSTGSQFSSLLAVLSLAADYKAWSTPMHNLGHRRLVSVPAFVRTHEHLYPDRDTSERAILVGLRYQKLDDRYPGTSAVVAFVHREFDRAGSLDELFQHLESEPFRFLPEWGKTLQESLEKAKQKYAQKRDSLEPRWGGDAECGSALGPPHHLDSDLGPSSRTTHCEESIDPVCCTAPELSTAVQHAPGDVNGMGNTIAPVEIGQLTELDFEEFGDYSMLMGGSIALPNWP